MLPCSSPITYLFEQGINYHKPCAISFKKVSISVTKKHLFFPLHKFFLPYIIPLTLLFLLPFILLLFPLHYNLNLLLFCCLFYNPYFCKSILGPSAHMIFQNRPTLLSHHIFSLSLSLFLSLFLSLSLSLSLSLYLSTYLSHSFSFSITISLFFSLTLFFVCRVQFEFARCTVIYCDIA